jgi:DNA polymerase III sliding clamp (beta) subunit (PCNA family)
MITVAREPLLSALESAAKVADPKSTLAVLSQVLIDATGVLRFRATNLRHEVCGTVDSKGSGSFLANARDLHGAVQAIEGDTVTLDVKPGFVQVKGSTKRTFKLATVDPVEFPAPMNVAGGTAELDGELLSALIGSVLWSARLENDKPEQSCVRLLGEGYRLRAMCADSGRGMCVVNAMPGGAKVDVMVPIETARMLLDLEGTVRITVDKAMAFECGGVRISAAQPVGMFPPVDRQIELFQPGIVVECNAEKLLTTIRAIQRVDRERDLKVRVSPGLLTLECTGVEGSSRDELEVVGGADYEAWVSASHFADALAHAGGDCSISFGPGDLDPFIIERDAWKAVVMPVREEAVRARKAK